MPWTQAEQDKIKIMQEDINNLSITVADTKRQLFEFKMKLEERIDELLFAIVGSPLSKDGGLIKRIDDMERIVRVWDKKMQKIGFRTSVLWGLVGAVAASFVKIVYDILIKK